MPDIFARLKIRRATAALWGSANPTLQQGEPGFETDAARLRIGDGVTAFASLRAFLSVPMSALATAQAWLEADDVEAQKALLGLTSAATSDLTGEVAFFARNTPPTGWLKANGAAVSRLTYADLYAAIGTTYGIGDGSTTFNLPDLRGEFPRGWDDGRGIDSGRAFGSAQGDLMRDHTHSGTTSSNGDHHHAINSRLTSGNVRILGSQTNSFAGFENSGSGVNWYKDSTNMRSEGAHTHSLTTGNPDGGLGGAENRPRNVALLACIKY